MSKNNKNRITDEAWLDILNGTKQADQNNQEEVETQKVRDILNEESTQELALDDIEATPEQESQYAEERKNLLAILKAKKLLDSD